MGFVLGTIIFRTNDLIVSSRVGRVTLRRIVISFVAGKSEVAVDGKKATSDYFKEQTFVEVCRVPI